jgi:hypothetical protein
MNLVEEKKKRQLFIVDNQKKNVSLLKEYKNLIKKI